jgi:hypothetical protein
MYKIISNEDVNKISQSTDFYHESRFEFDLHSTFNERSTLAS